jgi:hypothetical protein
VFYPRGKDPSTDGIGSWERNTAGQDTEASGKCFASAREGTSVVQSAVLGVVSYYCKSRIIKSEIL